MNKYLFIKLLCAILSPIGISFFAEQEPYKEFQIGLSDLDFKNWMCYIWV